jgi:hypothetical protein
MEMLATAAVTKSWSLWDLTILSSSQRLDHADGDDFDGEEVEGDEVSNALLQAILGICRTVSPHCGDNI